MLQLPNFVHCTKIIRSPPYVGEGRGLLAIYLIQRHIEKQVRHLK